MELPEDETRFGPMYSVATVVCGLMEGRLGRNLVRSVMYLRWNNNLSTATMTTLRPNTDVKFEANTTTRVYSEPSQPWNRLPTIDI